MGIKICCVYNNQGAWCTNKKTKRGLFGLGARCCTEYPYNTNTCKHKKLIPPPPPPPPKRIIQEDIYIIKRNKVK